MDRLTSKTVFFLVNFFEKSKRGKISFACFKKETRQSKHCGFSIYNFDNSKSKSMVRLVRAEKMVLSGLVFARKIARMVLIQNIQGLMGPLMINMALKM